MAQYMIKGNRVEVVPNGAINIQQSLPPLTYFIKFESTANFQGFYLEMGDNFSEVEKVYGNLQQRTDRIIDTYLDRKDKKVNTGILLSGLKGSGKTMQAKMVSNQLRIKHGIPTLIVADSFDSALLSLYLKDIDVPALILFEEFEKLYKSLGESYRAYNADNESSRSRMSLKDSQEGLLTLLDGVMNSNKLFIFTCNRTFEINDLLLNRPGRVWYHFKYSGLEENIIDAYCNEKIPDKESIKQIKQISDYLDEGFTFDVMQSIVEESLRLNTTPFEALSYLNIEPQPINSYYSYEIINEDGKFEVIPSIYDRRVTVKNYLSSETIEVNFEVYIKNKEDEQELAMLNYANRFGLDSQKIASKLALLPDDEEDLGSLGFNNSRKAKRRHAEITVDRSNLVSSDKKHLVYKKHGFKIILTKIRYENYWNNLLA